MADEVSVKDSGSSPLEHVNKTAVAVIAGLAVVGGLALAYFFNLVSDQLVGMAVAGGFVIVLAVLVLRVAMEKMGANPNLRYGAFALVLGMAAVALYPASLALHLGRPSASATLDERSPTLAVPSAGTYRVLVSGHLPEGSDARITYRLKSGDEAADGELKREYMTRRARRGPGVQVPEDHDVEAHELAISGNPPSLILERVSGNHELLVQVFRDVPPVVMWILMLLVALAGMFVEAKAPTNGTVVMAGVAAVAFGIIIKTANPSSMATGTLVGALLAAGAGALGGTILAAIGKKFIAAPELPGKKGGGKKDEES